MGGGDRVLFANYNLILSYIYPIFSLKKSKWLDTLQHLVGFL